MKGKPKKFISTLLTLAMVVSLITVMPLTASAATANIDIGTLSGSNQNSTGSDDAWSYVGGATRTLTLSANSGNYYLYGSNTNITIIVAANYINVTLDGLTTVSSAGNGLTINGNNVVITLVGDSSLSGEGSSGRGISVATGECEITGTGSLKVSGVFGISLSLGASLHITGGASVTAVGDAENHPISYESSLDIQIGDNSSLSLTNNRSSAVPYSFSAIAGDASLWKLTGDVTLDSGYNLTDSTISVTVAAGGTGKIARMKYMTVIDVSTLNASTPNNSSTPTASQWTYNDTTKYLTLSEPEGAYTLTGTNDDLSVFVYAANIALTLDNVDITSTSGGDALQASAYSFSTDDLTISLVGTNKLTASGTGRGMSIGSSYPGTTITSAAASSLTVTADSSAIVLNTDELNISGYANVTAISETAYGLLGGTNISVAADAKLSATGSDSGIWNNTTDSITLDIDGEAVFTGTRLDGIYYNGASAFTISGSGTVSAKGADGYSGIGLGAATDFSIVNCDVTAEGTGNAAIIIPSGTNIKMNDGAKLTIINGSVTAETHSFESTTPGSTRIWKLTNAAYSSGNANSTTIGATVAAGQTGSVERADLFLTELTVGLTAGDAKVTLAPQTAEAGHAYYYTSSSATVAAPSYNAAISGISGRALLTTATDISGANGTAIFVQVYKVTNPGDAIVGFGEASGTPSAAPTYGISLTPSANYDFGTATVGYGAQTAHSVTIDNTGNQATGALMIALSGTNAGSFMLSKTSITDIAVSGNESFTVTPNTGLAVGSYTATVTVSGTNVTPQSFTVSFVVTAATTYTTTITIPTVNSNAPAASVTDPAAATMGATVILPTVTANPGFTFSTWAVTAGGVSITNPTSASTASFTMGSANVTIEARFTASPLTFGNKTLTSGTYGTAYSANVTPATGGSGTYAYYNNPLPTGLTMTEAGVISGTPTNVYTAFTFNIMASDTITGATANATYTITINKANQSAPSITGGNISKTTADTLFTITASGGNGTGAYNYTSSNTSVATVNLTTGQVTIVGTGTTNLTAIRLGDTNYNASPSSAAVVLTVTLPALGGTASITGTSAIGGTLTAVTTSVTGGSGAFGYQWQAGGLNISGATSATYTIAGADAGKTITCVITRAGTSGSVTATLSGGVVPYDITITLIDNAGSDDATIDKTTARASDTVTVSYTVDSTDTTNMLTFTGVTLAEVAAAETGTRSYTVDTGDAVGGVIAINATFLHTSLSPQTLTFASAGNQSATYGDAGFTNAATGDGTGTIDYASSVPGVATVDGSGVVAIVGAGSTTITATIEADGTYAAASASYNLTVAKASQAAPAGLGKTDETAAFNDGTITDVTTAMEYKLSTDALYTAVTGTTITGLAPGTYDVRYAETSNFNQSPDTSVTIEAYTPPAILTPAGALDDGTVGIAYSVTLAASNSPTSWEVSTGTLPAGLSISSGGVISGTPSAAGTSSFSVTATNGDGTSAPVAYSITINAAPVTKTVSVGTQTGALTDGAAGSTTYTVTTTNIANGSYPVTVANLPAGVTAPATLTITGNAGTLTLAYNGAGTAGTTSNLTLTIDSTTSGNFSIVIALAGSIPVTGITVTGAGGAITITTNGGTLQMSAAVTPGTATDKTVTWSVTNGTGSATISAAGLLKATGNGTVTVRATANDGSGVSGTLVITISGQGGGGGGGGGGSSSSAAATVPAGDGTVSVTYTQLGGAVTLDLPASKVTEIIGKAKDGKATLDLSKLTGATNSSFPKTALTALANAGLAVDFKLPQGTLTMDKTAAASIAAQATGANLTVALNAVAQSTLTAAQRAAINSGDLVFNISVMSGTQVITNFDGTITVTVPYSGQLPVAVWYLNAAGELEKLVSTYDAATKTVTFTTNHLSLYVVGNDTQPPPEEPEATVTMQINLTIGSLTYTVNGETKTMDTAPVITDGRTLVPLRFIAEALGAAVDYVEATKTITMQLGGDTINLTIGELLSGMDVPATITDGRTMVPLRYISEAFGCEVAWDAAAKSIGISK